MDGRQNHLRNAVVVSVILWTYLAVGSQQNWDILPEKSRMGWRSRHVALEDLVVTLQLAVAESTGADASAGTRLAR